MDFSNITFVMGIIALCGSLFIYWNTKRDNEKKRLNDTLMNLLNTGITYPYLEDEKFIESIKTYDESEKAIRYNLYCIMWFNFLQDVYAHYFNMKDWVEDYIDVKEIVETHKAWWLQDAAANNRGYKEMNFDDFIKSYIK